ncbi:MAG TPA: type II toxin-antitoxin system RelE/ParE family toxin, partial [Pirellulales bacterium]|nr:type II toxin-antitoxin system RelE/ParE family toxin [Pirellulales bacterium]
MRRVLYSVQAEQDLRQIVEHIALDDLTAAIDWLDATEALFGLLATHPALGQRMETPRWGEVRQHTAGSYVIYYRFDDDGLQVLRVLYAAREQDP